MKITEAFSKGIIPKSYEGVFPLRCTCQEELEVNESLTKVWCPNPNCGCKHSARLTKMLTNFGVKGVGPAYCEKLWEAMERHGYGNSHVNVFHFPLSLYPMSSVVTDTTTLKSFQAIQKVLAQNLLGAGDTFSSIVSKLALPNFNINAKNLFDGCNSLEEFDERAYKEYPASDNPRLSLIQSCFGSGVQSEIIYSTLTTYEEDIRIAEDTFNIRPEASEKMYICITGKVSKAGKFTRDQFVAYCNNLPNTKYEVVNVDAGPRVACVVADEPSSSRKYSYGKANDILITSDVLVSYLRNEVNIVE